MKQQAYNFFRIGLLVLIILGVGAWAYLNTSISQISHKDQLHPQEIEDNINNTKLVNTSTTLDTKNTLAQDWYIPGKRYSYGKEVSSSQKPNNEDCYDPCNTQEIGGCDITKNWKLGSYTGEYGDSSVSWTCTHMTNGTKSCGPKNCAEGYYWNGNICQNSNISPCILPTAAATSAQCKSPYKSSSITNGVNCKVGEKDPIVCCDFGYEPDGNGECKESATTGCRTNNDCRSRYWDGSQRVAGNFKFVCDGYQSAYANCEAKNNNGGTCEGGTFKTLEKLDYKCIEKIGNTEIEHDWTKQQCRDKMREWHNNCVKNNLGEPNLNLEIGESNNGGPGTSEYHHLKEEDCSSPYERIHTKEERRNAECSNLNTSWGCNSSFEVQNKHCTRKSDTKKCAVHNGKQDACNGDADCVYDSAGEILGTCKETYKYQCNTDIGSRNPLDILSTSDSCNSLDKYSSWKNYRNGDTLCRVDPPEDSSCPNCKYGCTGDGYKEYRAPFEWSYGRRYYLTRDLKVTSTSAAQCKKKRQAVHSWQVPEKGRLSVIYKHGKRQASFCGYKGGSCIRNCAKWIDVDWDLPSPYARDPINCLSKKDYSSCESVSGCNRGPAEGRHKCCSNGEDVVYELQDKKQNNEFSGKEEIYVSCVKIDKCENGGTVLEKVGCGIEHGFKFAMDPSEGLFDDYDPGKNYPTRVGYTCENTHGHPQCKGGYYTCNGYAGAYDPKYPCPENGGMHGEY